MNATARNTATSLDNVIADHDQAYHGDNAPRISDAAYDALRDARDRLTEHPAPPLPDPTHHLMPVHHDTMMLSLTNVTESGDLNTRLLPRTGRAGRVIAMTPKLDGLALSIVYQDGNLVHVATRGNGATGEDVTANAVHIPGIPRTLPPGTAAATGRADIRGEAYIPPSAWEAYKADTMASGSSEPSNPRNAAAGCVRKKKPVPARLRHIAFRAYDWRGNTPDVSSYATLLAMLETQTGIETVPVKVKHRFREDNLDAQAEEYHRELAPDLPRDGIVVQLDTLQLRRELGTNNRAPLYAFARKWPTDAVTTLLQDIRIDVGRTGRHTPVAVLKPVNIDGVTVTRATLHHPEYIRALDIAPGDRVRVERAGSVIPAVLGKADDSPARDPDAPPWTFPTTCSCERKAPLDFSQAHAHCPADENCQPMILDRLAHAASRDALDIDGLSHTRITQLAGILRIGGIAELFREFWPSDAEITARRLALSPGWGRSSADKLNQSLQQARRQTLPRWLYALGIPHVGRTASRGIAHHAPSVDSILELADSHHDLTAIEGVNSVAAANFREALRSGGARRQHAIDLAEQLVIIDGQPDTPVRPLQEQRILFTGTFDNPHQAEAEDRVRALGAGTVRHTDLATLIIAGDIATRNAAEAAGTGIPVTDAAEFIATNPQPQQEDQTMQERALPLQGQHVVATGKLQKYTRSSINDEILRRGGTPQSSVTARTTLVLAGEKAGSKLTKAHQRGIPVIDETEFETRYA